MAQSNTGTPSATQDEATCHSSPHEACRPRGHDGPPSPIPARFNYSTTVSRTAVTCPIFTLQSYRVKRGGLKLGHYLPIIDGADRPSTIRFRRTSWLGSPPLSRLRPSLV